MTLAMPDTNILHAEYEQLKQSAKSRADIENWFKKHPEIFPNFTGNDSMNVKVFAYLGSIFQDDKTLNLYKALEIRYSLAVDKLPLTPFMEKAKLTPTHLYGATEPVTVKFELLLDLREWPFLVAEEGFNILSKIPVGDISYHDVAKSLWDRHFPSAPWVILENMHAAGLLPDNFNDFYNFVNQFSAESVKSAELPGSLGM